MKSRVCESSVGFRDISYPKFLVPVFSRPSRTSTRWWYEVASGGGRKYRLVRDVWRNFPGWYEMDGRSFPADIQLGAHRCLPLAFRSLLLERRISASYLVPAGNFCQPSRSRRKTSASHRVPAGTVFHHQRPPRTTISYWYEMVEKTGTRNFGYEMSETHL